GFVELANKEANIVPVAAEPYPAVSAIVRASVQQPGSIGQATPPESAAAKTIAPNLPVRRHDIAVKPRNRPGCRDFNSSARFTISHGDQPPRRGESRHRPRQREAESPSDPRSPGRRRRLKRGGAYSTFAGRGGHR